MQQITNNTLKLFDAKKKRNPPLLKTYPIKANNKYFSMEGQYKYQKQRFDNLKDLSLFLLRCPTGWGKTKLLQFLLTNFLKKHPYFKVVISIPQKIISPGFTENMTLKMPYENEPIQYGIISSHNLCGENNIKQKAKTLNKFISDPIGIGQTLQSRIAITTHKCLTDTCSEYKFNKFLKNVLWIIDEIHHSQATEINRNDVAETTIMNRLGNLIFNILKNDENPYIWTTTATFGRGDNLKIFPETYMHKFVQEKVTWKEYWDNMLYLESFQSIYVVYDDEPFTSFDEILSKKVLKTLVYCPEIGSRFLMGFSKKTFIEKVRSILLKRCKNSYIWNIGDKKENAIIDLTVNKDRHKKAIFIKENPNLVYAIISVDMMKEGADWPALEQTMDFAPISYSAPHRIQKFGRGTRDYYAKKNFTYYNFLPRIKTSDTQKMRELASEMFAQLVFSLVESAYFSPIVEWTIISTNGKEKVKKDVLSTLGEDTQQKLMTKCSSKQISLKSYYDQSGKILCNKIVLDAFVKEIEGLGIKDTLENKKYLAQQAFLYINRQPKPIDQNEQNDNVINLIEDIGFDKVKSNNECKSAFLTLASDICGTKTFAEMESLLHTREECDLEQLCEDIKNYVKKPTDLM